MAHEEETYLVEVEGMRRFIIKTSGSFVTLPRKAFIELLKGRKHKVYKCKGYICEEEVIFVPPESGSASEGTKEEKVPSDWKIGTAFAIALAAVFGALAALR